VLRPALLTELIVIIIRCPHCDEERIEEELTYGGEVGSVRPPEPECVSDDEWTDYLFMRSNLKGVLLERWCCAFGCGQWFEVRRSSVTHEISQIDGVNES
jgi:sarcosine oxidase, subunit delta